MQQFIYFTLIVSLLLLCLYAKPIDHPEYIKVNGDYHEAFLRPYDPFANAWNLNCNEPSYAPKPGAVFFQKINKDILLNSKQFQVGIQGKEKGYILDLQTDSVLQQKYNIANYSEAFSTIYLDSSDSKLKILQSFNFQTQTVVYQAMTEEQDALFGPGTGAPTASSTTSVQLGHIYILRISNEDGDTKLVSKLKVVQFIDDQLVVMRHQVLYLDPNNGERNNCFYRRNSAANLPMFGSAVALSLFAVLVALFALLAVFLMGVFNTSRVKRLEKLAQSGGEEATLIQSN